MGIVIGDDTPRSERAHMQPHGGGARTAVEQEGHRAVGSLCAFLEIGREKHRGFGRRIVLIGRVLRVLVAHLLEIVPALGMHHDGACNRFIGNIVAACRDGAFADLFGWGEVICFRRLFFRSAIGCGKDGHGGDTKYGNHQGCRFHGTFPPIWQPHRRIRGRRAGSLSCGDTEIPAHTKRMGLWPARIRLAAPLTVW